MATSVGTVWVDVRFNTASLGQDLGRSLTGAAAGAGTQAGAAAGAALNTSLGASLTSLGTSMGNLGRQVSLGLSLPLIAFGKAASDAFTEFDTAMTQTNALAGQSASVVEGWRDDVLELGEAYGVSGAEAAKGLYFISSSGVDAADAMSVLETSIKGAAIGLGTTERVADIATSALNSYGQENITAAEATDILTVAVREGKGEADDMAGALSRVIPLAASMGVSFGEVSGVMSALTLSGVSADEAATQINALLVSLQKLPNQAQRNMKALTGLDYATVQQDLKTKGLTETLREIYNAFGDNEDAIAKVFGNVRALRGITGLFGEKEEQTRAIVEQTTHALGAQDKAMEDTSKSASFALRQSQTDLSNAMTSIGATVTPILAGVTSFTAEIFKLTKAFGPAGQTVLVFAGAIAAAAGPLIYMGASLVRLTGNAINLFSKLQLADRWINASAAMSESTNAFTRSIGRAGFGAATYGQILGKVTIGLVAAAVAFALVNQKVHENDEAFKNLGDQGKLNLGKKNFAELGQTIDRTNAQIEEFNKEKERLAGSFLGTTFHGREIHDLNEGQKALAAVGGEAAKLQSQAEALAQKFNLSRDAALTWIRTQRGAEGAFEDNTTAIDAYTKAVDRNDASVKQAVLDTGAAKNTWSSMLAAVKETSDAFFGAESAQKAYDAAQQKVTDAKKAVVTAEKAHRDALADVAAAQRKSVQADQAAAAAARKLADAKQAAIDAQNALAAALAGPSEEEALDVRSARLALREAQEAARKPGQTPLERERNQINLARARIDLKKAEAAHDERIAELRKDVADATDGVRDAEQAQMDAIAAQADARQAIADAQAKERDTLNDIRVAQENVTQATLDAVGPAMALQQAQSDLNVMFQTGTIEADKFREYLIKLKDLYPELGAALDDYLGRFDKFAQEHPRENPPAVPTPPPATPTNEQPVAPDVNQAFRERLLNRNKKLYYQFIPGRGYVPVSRAGGGPVAAGQLAQVNERNVPELWTQGGKQWLLPTVSGRVTPQPVDASRNVGDIIVQGAPTPVQTAYEIRRQIRAKGI